MVVVSGVVLRFVSSGRGGEGARWRGDGCRVLLRFILFRICNKWRGGPFIPMLELASMVVAVSLQRLVLFFWTYSLVDYRRQASSSLQAIRL
jgi:hypothetical protein